MKNEVTVNDLPFLAGGGEMGELIRKKEWSKTLLGNPENWPQSLRISLAIILNSKFPMFLWWGPDLINFYNDAYRPSLGSNGKHPHILGERAEDSWPEIWHIIKPQLDQVLSGGDATWSEDQLIPIFLNGKMEDVYWTFSYSPVNDESGHPSGVLVTCYETTEKIIGLKQIKEREEQLSFALDAAELGTWDLNPSTNRFVGNDRLKEWFGLAPEEEIELLHALNAIAEKDRPNVIHAISKALQPGSDGNYEIEYTIKNPRSKKERIVIAKGKALFDKNSIAYRFSGTLQDITEQVIARKKAERSEKEFRNTVKQVAVGITIFKGPDFIVEMANNAYLQIVGKNENDFVGKPLFDSLPEIKDRVASLLTNVLTTGIPFYGTEFPVTLNRYGKKDLTYFNFAYQPYNDENGNVLGVIVIANEVTESVRARHSLAESEKQFRNLLIQSPIPMAILKGTDHIIELANNVMYEKIWRKRESEVIGRSLLDVFPELKDQKYPELLDEVLLKGKSHRETESIVYVQGNDGLKTFYIDYEYAPLFDTDNSVSGVMITVNNVTEKVEARQKVEDAEERLRLALEATELATWDLDLETREVIYSSRLSEIFGHNKEHILTHREMRNQVHPDDLHKVVEKAFDLAMMTGHYYYEARVVKPDKSICWIRTQGKVFFNEKKLAVKLIGTIKDITEEKHYKEELQEREQKFKILADTMPQFVWIGDVDGNLNYFNCAVFDYSGLTPDQVFTQGWIQIVHPDDREENITRWMSSIATGKDFLFEHRFKRSDGEYRWQLSRAIPQRDAVGNIWMWVGTSTDIHEQKTFSAELEKQVQERTGELEEKNKELEKMNAELKSFAYVSSHDLQEPLRKIQTFASRIVEKEIENLSEKGKDYFVRMNEAAKRMQTLIEDLLTYSRTSTSERKFSNTDLNEIINEVKNDLKETFNEKNATISANILCKANIIPFQFRQLMYNLIGNSLKFSKPGEPLLIKIECEMIKGDIVKSALLSPKNSYCHISISDNGIGFDPQYKERIFEVFQRLHSKEEYKGTGIGLSIVKKIVENHNGFITASGELDKGAVFDIFIPE
jgi:PAS domain S-box-containing protein